MSDVPCILDASALLAAIGGETGAERVHAVLQNARISAVNMSEVVAKLQERGVPDTFIDEILVDLHLTVVPFDLDQAVRAGKLRLPTRPNGLSLGDRACLGLTQMLEGCALTTDKTWIGVDVAVKIAWVR